MARRYLLGFDVGSSSVKASLTDVDNGEIVASAFYPDHEAPIMAVKTGWAEPLSVEPRVRIFLLLVFPIRCMVWFV